MEQPKKRKAKASTIVLSVSVVIVLLAITGILLAVFLIPPSNNVPPTPTVTPPENVPTSVSLWG